VSSRPRGGSDAEVAAFTKAGGGVHKKRFAELYDTYAGRLYNYALWMTRNKEASEDILQNVFIKIWKQPRVPSGERELEAWLYKVTHNTCLDFFRKSSRFSRFRLRYARETRVYGHGKAENRFVWEILGKVGETERTILYLHLKEGYSYREIGETLGLTETNVRVKAFRALGKLRAFCAKETA
jgi:RNA polymerase sigma-70 factor (ECF subfamily)